MKTSFLKIKFWKLGLVLMCCSVVGQARSIAFNVLPSANIFPNQEGILFPGFSIAPGIDAAAIPSAGKGTDVTAAYGPSLQSGDNQTGFLSVVNANQSFGFGLGYDGLQAAGGSMQNGVFAGTGVAWKDISMGLALRSSNIEGGFNPSVDFSLAHIVDHGFALGAVLYDIGNTKQIDIGLGYTKDRLYNFEVNFLLPDANLIGQSNEYKVLVGVGANPGSFSFHLTSIYNLGTSEFTNELSGGVWVSQHVNLFVQVASPETVQVGLNLGF